MNTQVLRRAERVGFMATALAASLLILGYATTASAAGDNKKPAPAKSAPAPKAAAHPSGGSGGAAHGASTGGSASHGPTANGARTTTTSHGPTANGGGSHTMTTGSRTTTTGGGMHGGAAGGMHAGGAGGAGVHGNAGVSRSAIHGGPAPRGVNEHVTRNGSAIRTRPGGRVSDIHDARRGMDVHRGLAGGRRVSMERADHSRVFAERGRRGFVERPYSYRGHDFARRSYYYHGRAYDRYYRGYGYRGVYLNVYAPGYYYAPAFYGWAYNPWAVPIAYGWGWGGSPWYGYYGGYFTPYPVYPSAAFWLTDYIISQDLQAAYAAHQEAAEAAGAAQAAGGSPELTPEVKQQIADEVKAQLALENQEAGQNAQQQDADPASSGIARMLADGRPHVFVAGGSLDVVDASSQQECALSDGDALQLQAPPPPDATSATLVVLASKGGVECARSSSVTVQLTDLQEMQNHMRETIDQGLQDLQAKQGKGGLPPAPASAQAQPAAAQYAAAAPPADPNVGTEIAQVDQQSDQAEKDVTAEAAQDTGAPSPVASAAAAAPPAPSGPPPSVELGQTFDQVKA
ncbi:MAG: hypothetical protein WCA11_07925, partial [Terracidiphilus sp.]